MTFVITEVENSIREWAQVLTGIPFFHAMDNTARQNGQAPNGIYGTVRLSSATVQGTPGDMYTDITVGGDPMLDHMLMDKRLITMSINTYRQGARDAINILQVAGYSEKSTQLLQGANIGLVSFSQLRDLTEVINGNFEERSQVDVMMNVVGTYNEDLFVIETVPIDNTTYDQQFEVKE